MQICHGKDLKLIFLTVWWCVIHLDICHGKKAQSCFSHQYGGVFFIKRMQICPGQQSNKPEASECLRVWLALSHTLRTGTTLGALQHPAGARHVVRLRRGFGGGCRGRDEAEATATDPSAGRSCADFAGSAQVL